jgi:2-polyprenyl-3-methyl-5-hydroxy-6-metoxy-1,4-benzoquinol methylase
MPDEVLFKDVVAVNREFYDSLYKTGPSWLSAIRALTSFDQQSKARPNYVAARELAARKDGVSGKLRVLDFGAGWGTFLLKWPARTASCWCYDISDESTRRCVSAGRLLRHDVAEWSGLGGEFDLVCCSHVLEHVPDDLALLQRLRSITRPGGIVLLNVPINEVREDPKHVRRYEPRSLRSVVEAAGLVEVLEREADRVSTFLLKREKLTEMGRFRKAGFRMLRLILALTPYSIVLWLDRNAFSNHAPSQLIVGARNASQQ